nr:FAD-dependent thymidylate synthase [Petrotoga sp. HKA.pet.4.5]
MTDEKDSLTADKEDNLTANKESIKVLDKGFVTLVDMMGDDRSAVRAARVSHGKDISTDEKDRKLIDYLMEHGHLSPFEHITFTFHVKAPIFVVRQWFRHRIGMSPNEISRRYTSKNVNEFYVPDHIRLQDTKDKQNSILVNDEKLKNEAIEVLEEIYKKSYEAYEKLINMGVAREMARIILPVGEYTEFYLTTNVRALMHFLDLRASSHAQWEIQEYAKALAQFFQKTCPWSYEAYLKYQYKGDLLK